MQRILMLCLAVCALHTAATAQRLNQWTGGQPGRETDWSCAENWSLGRVPDWTQDVVVADVSTRTNHYPIVRGGPFEVGSLVIPAPARLTVAADATLIVAGANSYATGLWNDGRLTLLGKLQFEDAPHRNAGSYGGRGQVVETGAQALVDY